MEKEAILKNWRERGYDGFLWVDPPGQVWRDYVHEANELFLVLAGEMELEMNGQITHPKVGEEILIPAGVMHTVRNIGSGVAHWLYAYKVAD